MKVDKFFSLAHRWYTSDSECSTDWAPLRAAHSSAFLQQSEMQKKKKQIRISCHILRTPCVISSYDCVAKIVNETSLKVQGELHKEACAV